MSHVRSLSIGASLVLRAATGAAADELAIEPIEVEAAPIQSAEERAPTAFATTIDVAERQAELETPADVLGESVGVQIRRFGGIGSFSTLSIRGSDANQVQLYVDEIPVSQAQNETTNLANLPLYALDRIEVYRGTIPIGFGGLGGGGVVNLVTKPPSATAETEIAAGYGSFDTRRLTVSHTRRVAGFDVLGHVTYLGSDGDFSFLSSNGTDANPDDDERVDRKNNAFDSVAGLAKVSHPVGEGLRLDAMQELFFKDQGVPGPESPQFTDTSLRELRSLSSLRLVRPAAADRPWAASASLFGIYQRQEFDDPKGEFGVVQDTRNQTGLVGASTTGTHYGLPFQAIAWFGELAYEIFAPFNETSDPRDGPDQTRLRATLGLQDEIGLLDERVLLVPTLRYHHVRDSFSAPDIAGQPAGDADTVDRDLVSPSFGADLRPLSWLSLRGNIGRFQRPPNFSELFGNTGVTNPNPGLDPETSFNRDVGFVAAHGRFWRIDSLRLEYAYFDNEVDDLISFRQVRPAQFEAQNFDDVHLSGHEVTFEGSAFDHVRLAANYTRQDSENQSRAPNERGKELPLLPRDEVYLRFEVFGRWAAPYYEYSFLGRSFLDPTNLQEVDSREAHTIGVTVTPTEALQLHFEVANLTDEDLRDLADFPLPGRSFFGSVRCLF